jgi:hypothetical protein
VIATVFRSALTSPPPDEAGATSGLGRAESERVSGARPGTAIAMADFTVAEIRTVRPPDVSSSSPIPVRFTRRISW